MPPIAETRSGVSPGSKKLRSNNSDAPNSSRSATNQKNNNNNSYDDDEDIANLEGILDESARNWAFF